jgi:hypothetical protein
MYIYRLIEDGIGTYYLILKDGVEISRTDRSTGNVLVNKLRSLVSELERIPQYADIRNSIVPFDTTEDNLIEKEPNRKFSLEISRRENVNIRVREDIPTLTVFVSENTDI